MRSIWWLGAALAVAALQADLRAQAPDSTLARDASQSFCFWAKALPACRLSLLTEAHVRYRLTRGPGGQSKVYLTGELGLMRNVATSRSLGGSFSAGYDWSIQAIRLGFKGRYRWWLGSSSRLDLQAGGVLTPHQVGDDAGLLAGVTYSLRDKFLLSAELDYIPGEQGDDIDCPPFCEGGATMPAVYVGGGLGSQLAFVSYAGAAVVGLLALLVAP